MRWNSVRVRLTLWYVAVLGLVLVGFALMLSYSVRVSLAAAVDRDLADRAHGFGRIWSRFDSRRRPAFSREPLGPGPLFPDRVEADGPPRRRAAAPPAGGTEQERRGFFRRPRVLDLDGREMIPLSGDEPWDPDTVLVASVGKEIFSTISFENEPVRVYSAPLWRHGEVEGVVQFAHSLTEQNRLNDRLARTLLTLIPLALLVAGLGGAFLTDRALRPVRQISQAAAQIGAEDLSRRLVVRGQDELSELASTFNGMIGRLEEAFQRLESAYEQQRRFTGDASHELRTPLTTIKANTSLALSGEHTPAEYREALTAADQAADSMSRIVQDLLLLARSDGGQLVMEPVPVCLGEVLRRAARGARSGGPAVRLELPEEPAMVSADPHYLTRLFLNLLENAERHTPPEGRITLGARLEGDLVVGSVEDTGEGIPAEHLPHVCERFYRVDPARSRMHGGAGLGLSICRSIAEAHGGTLQIESEPGRGTTVTVALPRAPADAEPVPAGGPERLIAQ